MIQKLRHKMIFICSSITALILVVICIIAFSIFNHHYQAEERAKLETQLNTLALLLQQNHSISHHNLKKIQEDYHLLIHIEDNGTPLLYHSSLEPIPVQELLFSQAQTLATEQYNFSLTPLYFSSLDFSSVLFQFRGENTKDYLAALCLFPTQTGLCKIIMLEDLTHSNQYILHIKLLFAGLVISGTLLLIIFSFFFVSMAIKPIEAARQKQTEFVAAASHELRAPLTVIEAGMSSLTYEPDSSSAHFISIMKNECRRMQKLISDLLLLARSDTKKWAMNLADCEIDGMLIEIYDSYYSLYQDKKLTLNLDLPEDLLPTIQADSDRIKQVLTILLDNALSYVSAPNSVTLKASLCPQCLLLQVIDTGTGIRDEDKPHIFERFYQGDQSRHEKNHYGLGLSIAYEIIALHNGKLTLTDTPGGGCTFTISLPLSSHLKHVSKSLH